jgi:hypothetical protein
LTFLSSGLGASVFFEGYHNDTSAINEWNFDAGASYLRDSLLLASDETEESAKHTEQGENSTSKRNTSFGMSLESRDRVDARVGNESECLVAKELDRVLSKGRRFIERFIISRRQPYLQPSQGNV